MPTPSAPAPRRALLIYNPKSGRGETNLPEFVTALGAQGWAVTARELQPIKTMAQLLDDAEHFGAIIAAGGDGTVSSVAYELRYRNVPLLAYPAGTANLIAQNLELEDKPAELAAIVTAGQTLRLDIGELEVQSEGGSKHGFVMLAGAGADAAMIRDAEEYKGRFGVMAYVVGAMKQLQPKATHFSLELDGQVIEHEAIAVMVANFGMANYRLPIAAGVSPSDGKLTVVVLKPGHLLNLLPHLLDSVRARLHLSELNMGKNMALYQARSVKVTAAQPFPLQYDGELHTETTPFVARVLPGAVRFLTPVAREDLNT